MIMMIITELCGRRRLSSRVLVGEGQSLGIKSIHSIGPVDAHWSHIYINSVRFICFILAAVKFTKSYQGRTIKSKVGLSVNFTWTFSGDVGAVHWGIKRAGVANDFESNGKILSLNKNGAQTFLNPGYVSRVTGSRSGNLKSGEVFFSLNVISKRDANYYLCIIRAGFGLSDQYDDVRLIVEGIVNLRSVIINRIKSFHYSKGVSCRKSSNSISERQWGILE